jgi:hypothetical protein
MQIYTTLEIGKIQKDIPYLVEIMEWVKSFLAKPNPDLGRRGSVCPYVPHALKSNSINLTVINTQNLEQQQIEEIVLAYRDIFLELEPKAQELAINKALLLIFPDIQIDDATQLIDGVQQKLKPFFVDAGLMIGEFHKRNQTPGQHNPNFRPLRSPIPLIAIRFMVESDLPFLQSVDDPGLRVRYLAAYLKHFGNQFKDEENLKTAQQILALARKQLEPEKILL